MKLVVRARTLTKRVTLTAMAFVLALSGAVSAVPYFVSTQAGAVPMYTVVGAVATVTTETDLRDAINGTAQTIVFGGDITVNAQITVNRAVTIDGNGKTLTGAFAKTGNSNNAALGIQASNVTVRNLVVDGTGNTNLYGINVYESSNVLLDGVTISNFRTSFTTYGLLINRSQVTVNNITTRNNGRGINVDKGTPHLTVNGQSHHTELTAIYVDSYGANYVTDTNSQYSSFWAWGRSFRLNSAPAVPAITAPTENQVLTTTSTTVSWNAVSGASTYDISLDGGSTVFATGIAGTSCELAGLANKSTNTVLVRAVAQSGLASNWSAARTFTVNLPDTTAPVITLNPQTVLGYFGVNDTPGVSVKDETELKEARIYRYVDGSWELVKTYYPTAPANVWTGGGLGWMADGKYKIEAEDVAGNIATSQEYVIDRVMPTNVSWQLQPNAYYGINADFHVRPITSEKGIDKAVYIDSVDEAHLVFRDKSDNKNLDTKNTQKQALWNSLAEGKHHFIAVFKDDAGNTVTLNSKTFVVDRTKPVIYLDKSAVKGYYKQGEVAGMHVSDANYKETRIYKLVNGGPVYSGKTYTDAWFGLGWLKDNTYKVVSEDKAGNTVEEIFTIDRVKPVVDGTAASSTNPKEFTITTTDATISSGIARTVGNIYKYDPTNEKAGSDGYYLYKSNTSTSEKLKVSLTSLPDGKYYVRYNASDKAGNISVTKTFKFTIDTEAPVISVKDDYRGTKEATTPIFSEVSFKLHDAIMLEKYDINGHVSDFTNNAWSDANFKNIKQYLKQYQLNTITVYDVAGNSTSYSFMYDPTPPRTSYSLVKDGQYVTDNNEIKINYNDDTIVKSMHVVVVGQAYSQTFNINEKNGSKTLTIGDFDLADGAYTIRTIITDTAGNNSVTSDVLVNVDNKNPGLRLVVNGNDNAPNGVVLRGTVQLEGYSDDKNQATLFLAAFEPGYEGWNDHATVLFNAYATQTIQDWDTTKVDDGTYTLRLEAKDKADNDTKKDVTIIIDNNNPTATFEYSNNSSTIVNTDVTVTMTTSEPVENTPEGWTSVPGSSTKFTKVFSDNTKFSVSLVDKNGFEGTAKGEVKRIDTIDPVITGLENNGIYTSASVPFIITEQSISQVLVDGKPVQFSSVKDWDYKSEVTGEGKHTIMVVDKAGNKSIEYHIVIDSNAPIVTVDPLTSPTDVRPQITGTANDLGEGVGVKGVTVRLLDSEGNVVEESSVDNPADLKTDGKWSWTPTKALTEEASYTVVAYAEDKATNTSSTSIETAQPYWTTLKVRAAEGGTGTKPTPAPPQAQSLALTPAAPFIAFTPPATALGNQAVTAPTTPAATEDEAVQGVTDTKTANASDNDEAVLGDTDEKTWSLVNAVIAVVMAIAGVATLVGIFRKKDGDKQVIVRVLSAVLAAAAVLVFFVVEHIPSSMIWVNNWTLLFAVLAVAQIIAISRTKKENE